VGAPDNQREVINSRHTLMTRAEAAPEAALCLPMHSVIKRNCKLLQQNTKQPCHKRRAKLDLQSTAPNTKNCLGRTVKSCISRQDKEAADTRVSVRLSTKEQVAWNPFIACVMGKACTVFWSVACGLLTLNLTNSQQPCTNN
jgi:hypothetical protein